jgi:flagellar basal body-associated protein FliL
MTLRRALLLLIVVISLLAAGLGVYAARVYASAAALVSSAREIHSTADAERQIAAWRNRSDRSFWGNTSTDNRDRSYDIHVDNGLLYRLRIASPTMVGTTITMRDGELRYIILTMFTGKNPNTTAGVWVQEWFDSGTASDFRVSVKDRPRKASVEFSSRVPEPERQKAFALNTSCLIRLGGCRSAEDILPGVWRLDIKRQ